MAATPTYDELLARIVALENREITVDDLPVTPLQRRLEQKWQPDASLLLQPYSITSDLLDATLRGAAGGGALAGKLTFQGETTQTLTGLSVNTAGLYIIEFNLYVSIQDSINLRLNVDSGTGYSNRYTFGRGTSVLTALESGVSRFYMSTSASGGGNQHTGTVRIGKAYVSNYHQLLSVAGSGSDTTWHNTGLYLPTGAPKDITSLTIYSPLGGALTGTVAVRIA